MIGRLSLWYKDNVSNEVDCLACRLVSGIGLLGIGAYLLAQSKKRPKPLENYTMKSLAAAVGLLGVARLGNANFLKATAEEPKEQETKTLKNPAGHQFFARR
ncbi:uncharacterized protein LOC119563119 [Drosophila subpulchrella]|uniref:uncharacterized protein LOC119563119 n=1 Tax=Drosophila subpulchrella TaxID=1486046 RepID=UPI0018A153EC|nr:uncharacterized protein LOC119563119 [Drosophila subpulchrella]